MTKVEFDRAYGVSALLFDFSLNPFSPADMVDYERTVSYDEDGKEIISFVPVDYKKITESLGSVDNWSLSALLKAGVNPNFGIHTASSVSRLEGVDAIQGAEADVESIINSNVEEEVK